MHLPSFDIPLPPLGFDIPLLAHPPVVHFAIVIPVFILILEIINLVMKRRGLTVTTFVFFTLLMVIYFAAFATGKTDGSETWDMLTKAGQEDLKEHKLIGIYLMLGTVVIFFAKLFSMALRTWWMRLLYLLILTGFVGAVFYQGKEGGELVYKHGANNERVMELSEEVFDLQEELDELKEESASDEEEATDESAADSESTKADTTATQKHSETTESESAQESSETTPQSTQEPQTTPVENGETNATEERPADAAEHASNSTAQTVTKETDESTGHATEINATQATEEAAASAVESAREAGEKAAQTAKEAVKEAASGLVESAKEMMGSKETE